MLPEGGRGEGDKIARDFEKHIQAIECVLNTKCAESGFIAESWEAVFVLWQQSDIIWCQRIQASQWLGQYRGAEVEGGGGDIIAPDINMSLVLEDVEYGKATCIEWQSEEEREGDKEIKQYFVS